MDVNPDQKEVIGKSGKQSRLVTDLAGDDGMHRGPGVPNHENELAVGEHAGEVGTGFEREGILVAQPGSGFAVTSDDFQDEGRHPGVDHVRRQP